MTLKEYLETKRNADGSYWIDPRLVDVGYPFNYNCERNGEMIYVGEGGELACLDEECFQKKREIFPDDEDEWIETFNITYDDEYDEPFYSNHDIEDNDRWLRELLLSKDERIAEIDKKIKNLEEQKQWLIDKE